jgi:hypothetical protein
LAKKVDLDDLSQIGWFREDDDLMTEVDEILLIERKRLEKVILACDRLKQVKHNLRMFIGNVCSE